MGNLIKKILNKKVAVIIMHDKMARRVQCKKISFKNAYVKYMKLHKCRNAFAEVY